MKEYVLTGEGHRFTEIPRATWEQHVAQAPQDISKRLSFMTKTHHLIRYFVVRKLPRIGKPISPELISEELNMSLSKTEQVKGLYLTMDQAVYSIPISQGALFAFK